ncbi:metallophosphoesterase [Proteinivorax hydrogeniformans]|uniref:Metallophosphoesterase n=1 Tax=Proteinivorax hydrogeniformans TaxID=1826727 RepID=A0AAU8HW70_9FIRM
MSQILIAAIVTVFIAIYTIINFYVGIRLWLFVSAIIPFFESVLYWMIFWIIAYTYVISRVFNKIFPSITVRRAKKVGAYWLALLFYFMISFAVIDLTVFLVNFFRPGFSVWDNELFLFWFGAIFLVFITVIIIKGYKNASEIEVINYSIAIPKKNIDYDKLNIVAISDLHLGTIVDNRLLQKFVDEVNRLEPDIVVILGDIVDEDVRPFIQLKMEDTLAKISPKIGSFAVLGNHDYFGGGHKQIAESLERANIKVLVDEHVTVLDNFVIAGRMDPAGAKYCGKDQIPLNTWMKDVDFSNPVALLTHQPTKFDEAIQIGVDLQLSGHTHRGQLFPNNFLTKIAFENHWGQYSKGEFTSIVTAGAGTWGPPIRTGHKSEIVQITLNIKKEGEEK